MRAAMKKLHELLTILFSLIVFTIFPQDQFTEQTSILLAGVRYSSVAWGDYNNDGDLDILLTGQTSGGIVSKIYQNNGDNTFTEQTSIFLTGVHTGSVSWGDYDNDGDLDILLTGNLGGDRVSKIYSNNGDNTFTEQTAISLTGVYESSVAWGDYDNDGDLDILLTGSWGVSKIYRNNGDNTFTEQTSISLTGVHEGCVAWGDYDNDGNLDILLTGGADFGGNPVSKIYRNNGDNSFTEQTSISLTGVSKSSVAWGDYDNDGHLDILLTGSGVSKIYRNNGDNTFTDQTSISLTGVNYGSVAWGDYDNDGDLDILLTGNLGANQVSKIYCNNGDNTFIEQTSIALTGVRFSSVAWGDYDNDGDLDILLTGDTGSGYVSKIYRNSNTTANTKPSAPTNLAATVNGNDVTFSWDKSTDTETPQNGLKYNLVIGTTPNAVNTLSPMSDRSTGYRRVINLGNTNHNNSWTIKGLADGLYYWSVQAIDNAFAGSNFATEKRFAKPELFTEQTSISLTGVYSSSVAWGDYDNDGDLDILMNGDTGGYTSFTKLYKNNSGSFVPITTNLYNTDFGSVAWGDFDNDGDLDILLTGFPFTAKVYRNDGSDTFTDIGAFLTSVDYSSAVWGDYDNDGDLDILLSGSNNSGDDPVIKIYQNNGGVFTEISAGLTPVVWSSVAWGDYDNDGDLDILLTGRSGRYGAINSKIFRNDGNNIFTDINAGLLGVYYSSVAWGDYDNDGDLDVMLAGWNGSVDVAKIYRNDNGLFIDINTGLTGVRSCSVAWGDYDNDGDLDILLAGYNEAVGNISEIYRNDGSNTFTKQTSIVLENVGSSSVAWGDYDNDGDLDILLTGANSSGAKSKIYSNNHITPNTIPNIPTNLSSIVNGSGATLSWNKSTDAETPQNGLKYNIVVGSTPGAIDKLSPMSDRNTGYRKIVNSGNANHSNDWTIKGLAGGLYYWTVQTIDNNFSGSNFASEQSFRVTHFTKNWINPYLPMNIYITSATIDGVDLGAGDEIAVFDGNNCVGLIYLNSSIPSGGYVSILASTDDPTTPEIDGFVPGHSIIYKFWNLSRSSEIHRITATYSGGDGTFSSLGTAVLGLAGIYTINQDVALTNGWNIFSLLAVPGNPNMLQVLNSLITSGVLIKVQDELGNAVEQLPPPIGWINNIGNWVATEGYYIKVNANSTLSITDPPVQLPLNIPLKNGWNIISYPVPTQQNALTVLQPLITANQLVKVQDEAGNAVEYLPPPIGWVNNIGNFRSGEGYYLKANAITSLTLNEPLFKPSGSDQPTENKNLNKITANHFVPIYPSPYLPMNIYVNGADLIGGQSLCAGDEIGIFDGVNCVGAGVLTSPIIPSNPLAMIASTDDPGTPAIDGFIQGHAISYKFWLSAILTEINEYTANYTVGNGTFVSQGTELVNFTNILPVELTSFSAEVTDNQVTLKWATATEVNNYGFEVERKLSDDWQKLGFVQGHGNSSSPKQYSFIDDKPYGGSEFKYRLKQIDNNGHFEYSDIVEVEIIPDKYALFQNYPNPFNSNTIIRYQLPKESKVTLKIYDVLGAEVLALLNEKKEPGVYEIEFNAQSLPSGTYIYRILEGSFVETKKMILLK
jgi:predicted nucleotidyltransferase